MSSLIVSPAAAAALKGSRVPVFGAIALDAPGRDVRVIAGSIEMTVFGEEYSGGDAVFGTIAAVDAPADGVGEEAPSLTLTMLPPDGVALDEVASPELQGSRVRLIFGPYDLATGVPVPDPIVLFDGEIEVPTIKWRQRGRELSFRVGSVFSRFFEVEEGIRLSDSWLQSVHPGALGLEFATGVAEPVPWGTNDLGSVKLS